MIRKVIVIVFLLSTGFCHSFSQDMISGTVNHYLKVLSVSTDQVTYKDTIAESNFIQGDKVLLIQMTGVDLYYDGFGVGSRGQADRGTKNSDRNTGKYEILQIGEVNTSTNTIVFTSDLNKSFDNGEKIQLVKILESDNAIINGPLTAQDWNGSTGGVLALIVFDTLTFNNNIDVSNKGFRGAQPETNYTGGCRTSPDTINFYSTELNRAGNKGEGNITTAFPYSKGCYFASSGGGGGNGLFAGGGGGANYGDGGNGGRQAQSCPFYPEVAMGGLNGNDFYNNGSIVMGGGGGTGVQSSTTTASKGGDGGGIVIIAADVVRGNGSIQANGENVNGGPYNASGGGGGAGGTVLIDATTFSGSLSISVKGGKGGNTGSYCTGSGGGGGGGVFWYSGQVKPSFTFDTIGGAQGTISGCNTYGSPGLPGKLYSSLLLPLNGFLFNTIKGQDTICAGQQPKLLKGSDPKGGEGIYTYKWEQSINKILWTPAQGTGADQRDFTPAPLDTTTSFRRIVNAPGAKPQADTVSKSVEIYVYPAIKNNIISGTDTICYNLTALPITGLTPTGGNGSYTYQWQDSITLSNWNNIGSSSTTNLPYSPGKLTASRYYRRFITSTKYCTNYSNKETVTVLPSITNNLFLPQVDTVICQGLAPGKLRASQPANGDNTYSYLWQKKDAAVWTDIPSSNLKEITTGTLATTTQYRRVVYSGNDKACIDTSGIKNVTVLNAITNNNISTDSARYCEGDSPHILTGSSPGGADGPGSYSYKWLQNVGSSWSEISSATGSNYTHGTLTQSIQFKRIAISGTYGACKDTTSPLNLTVIPAIINNLGLNDQEICENNTPLPFNPPAATGGNGSYSYEWLSRLEGASSWITAPGLNNQIGYASPALVDSSSFARQVTSDICTVISSPVNVIVYKTIKNNSITGNSIKYTCYNSSEAMTGSVPTNGKPGDYLYLWQMSSTLTDWTSAAGKSSNNTSNFETSDLIAPMYYRRVAYSPATNFVCVDTSVSVQVLINQLPTGDIISAKDTTCAGGTIQLKYNISGEHSPWIVTFGDVSSIGSHESLAEGTDSVSFEFSGTQNVRMLSITDDSLCFADLSSATGVAEVKVYDIPVANAGENDEICSNQYTLNATKSIANTTGLWQSSIGTFNDPATENATITINSFVSGIVNGWVKWTETNWTCQNSDSVYLIFYEQPATIDAGPDQMLDFKFRTRLDALPPSFGGGKWTVSKGDAVFENDTLAVTDVMNLAWDNILKWTVTNGTCPSITDSMHILVNNLKLQNGITPGSGTTGGLFKIEIANAEYIKLTIFNRLGQQVFKSDNYTEENFWDGTNKNNLELPEGTYFYVLIVKINGLENEFTYKSYIELIR